MKSKKYMIIILILLLLLGVGGFMFWKFRKAEETSANTSAAQEDEMSEDTVRYQGAEYRYNSDIKAVLFMGVDKSEPVSVDNHAGQGGQSDTLLLAVLDQEKKTAQLLEISRDTMTDVEIYDEAGEYLATEKAQIALQYAYGMSAKRSSQMTKETVSHLLYDIPIRDYLSLNVEGIAPIVDAIGGVTLTIPEDYTSIDPLFVKDSQVTLNGEQAERYVRYRDTSVAGSNTQRMDRQNDFLRALLGQLNTSGLESSEGYQLLINSAGEYLDSNMTAEEMKKLSEYEFKDEIVTLPGEMTSGAEHDEFVLDDEKTYEIVLNLFYKKVD